MNERIEHCLYQAGLTAQGCWDELDDYAKEGIEKFAQLIVQECVSVIENKMPDFTCKEEYDNLIRKAGRLDAIDEIKEHFGVK